MSLTYHTVIRLLKNTLPLILAMYFILNFYHPVSAADLATAMVIDGTPELWGDSAPPSFTDNNGITAILDYKNGNWQYYISPYLNLQPRENQSFGISQAYLDWDNGNFGISLGRKITTLGPGRYGYPLLGPLGTGISREGYDQIGYHFIWGNLKYQKFYALVSKSSYRMLLGQRTTYDLGRLTLGFSEAALANDQAPGYVYLPIPLLPLPGPGNCVNIAIDLDLAWRVRDDFKLYGQYYIDDRPFPTWENGHWSDPQWDHWVWMCGYQGGFEWQNAFRNPRLTLYSEYTRIDKYTYYHVQNLDWTYHGYNMGDSLGPDADRLNVELIWKQSPEWQWSFAYQRERRGEGKIGDHWTYVPGQMEVFLTGVVETTDLLAVGASWKNGCYEIGCTIGLTNIQNVNHVVGKYQLSPRVSVNAKFYLP